MRQNSPPKYNKANGILISDTHFTTRQPKCRTDNFLEAVFAKLDFITELQQIHECPVFHSGDVFDEWFLHKGDQWLITELIKRVRDWICIPGQHDLPQHNLKLYSKSSLALMEEAGSLVVIRRGDLYHKEGGQYLVFPWGAVTGFPWGTELIPEPSRKTGRFGEDSAQVALVHRMVYPNRPPYPGAEHSGGTALSLTKQMPGFDLIVTGDNHETFTFMEKGRLLVNPGSMVRTSAKQADHEPSCFLWYAKERKIVRVTLPHQKKVISREHIDITKKRDERITAFVEHLQGEVDLDLSFKENVLRYLEKNKVRKPVRELIMEVIE